MAQKEMSSRKSELLTLPFRKKIDFKIQHLGGVNVKSLQGDVGGGNVEANLLMHKAQAEKKKTLFITQIIKKLIKSKNHR